VTRANFAQCNPLSAADPPLAARSAAQIFSGLSDDEVFLLGEADRFARALSKRAHRPARPQETPHVRR
jgi:hypothetical protein